MLTKTKLLCLIILFCIANAEGIIPDRKYPVMLKYASKNATGTVIQIRSQLPSRATASITVKVFGIGHWQYLVKYFQLLY
jgi:hypothetical protein